MATQARARSSGSRPGNFACPCFVRVLFSKGSIKLQNANQKTLISLGVLYSGCGLWPLITQRSRVQIPPPQPSTHRNSSQSQIQANQGAPGPLELFYGLGRPLDHCTFLLPSTTDLPQISPNAFPSIDA